ncbi:MAG TPA: IclR family transcriptional regulator [Solirubrobacterales bacterium]|nr:IclR family transcriptional regulator [Solirubrobacterales bacterium]
MAHTQDNGREKSPIQVIDRATWILRVLGAAKRPLGVRELARRVELSPSTTRRILVSLCDNGFCEQTGDGNYQLGLTLLELGSKVEAGLDLRTRALPALRRLAEVSDLTAFLAVRREDRAITIERVDGRYAFSLAVTVGSSLPLHAGGISRALLAYLPEDEARGYIRQGPLRSFTDRTLVTESALIGDREEIRRVGYAISEEDVTPGVAALAMPIFDHRSADEPVGSISVAGLVPHVIDEKDRVLGLVREAAEEISRELGHRIADEQPV